MKPSTSSISQLLLPSEAVSGVQQAMIDPRPVLPVLDDVVRRVLESDLIPQLNFKETFFVLTQHLFGTTVNLLEALCSLGAQPNFIHILGKCYSAMPEIEEEMKRKGFIVHDMNHRDAVRRGEEYHPNFQKDLDVLWQLAFLTLQQAPEIKTLLVGDDGGRGLVSIPEHVWKYCQKKEIMIVGFEQTTRGLTVISEHLTAHPELVDRVPDVVSVAGSKAKRVIESAFIAETVVKRLKKLLPDLDHKRNWCGVIGRGAIGEAIRKELLSCNQHVLIYDANDAFLEQRKPDEQEILKKITEQNRCIEHLFLANQIIFGCTGRNVMADFDDAGLVHLFNESKSIVSCSSERIEFENLTQFIARQSPQLTRKGDRVCQTPEGHEITMVQDGFPVNFDRTPECDPEVLFRFTRSLLLSGIIEAGLLAVRKRAYPEERRTAGEKIISLSLSMQRFIVARWLQLFPQPSAAYPNFLENYRTDALRTFFNEQPHFLPLEVELETEIETRLNNWFSLPRDFDFNAYGSPAASDEKRKSYEVPSFSLSFFTKRPVMLTLMDHLQSQERIPSIVLLGDGGVGKTYLLRYVLDQCRDDYSFRAFFNAQSKSQLDAEYLALGEEQRLFLHEHDDLPKKINAVKVWLGQQHALLGYDNVERAADLEDYLPKFNLDRTRILITSRDASYQNTEKIVIHVDAMTIDEAKNLVHNYLGQEISDAIIEQFLALLGDRESGYLPLAITQAGAYILENETLKGIHDVEQRIIQYGEIYKRRKEELLSTITSINEEHRPVYITWDISMRDIERGDPEAKNVLIICAYLCANHIPRRLIRQFLSSTEMKATPGAIDVENKITNILHQYSIIRRDADTISLHPLLQEVIRCKILEERSFYYADLIKKFTTVLLFIGDPDTNVFYGNTDIETINRLNQLTPICLSLIEHAESLGIVDEDLAELCLRLGSFLNARQRFDDAEKVLNLAQQHSRDRGRLANVRQNLFNTHFGRGDHEYILQHTPATMSSSDCMNAGVAYHNQGKYLEAIKYYQLALSGQSTDPAKCRGIHLYSIAQIHINLASSYLCCSPPRYQDALTETGIAKAFFESCIHQGAGRNSEDFALIHFLFGRIHFGLRNAQGVIENLPRAFDLYLMTDPKKHFQKMVHCCQLLVNLCKVDINHGPFAIHVLTQLLSANEQHNGNNQALAENLHQVLANLYAQMGQAEESQLHQAMNMSFR